MANGPAHCTVGASVGIGSLWVMYSRSSLALVLEYFSPLWRECIVQHAEGCNSESQMLLPQAWLRLVIKPLLHFPFPHPIPLHPTPLHMHFLGCWLSHNQLCPASHPLLLGSSEPADPTDVWIGGHKKSGEDERDMGQPGKQVRKRERGGGSVPPTMFYWVWNPFGSCFVFLPSETNFFLCFAFNL